MARSGRFRRAAATAAAFGLFASALLAQPPASDPLADARVRQRITDQKVEAGVTEALREAERLAKTNPAKAAQVLRAAQSGIDTAVGISGESRRMMTTLLTAKLNGVEGRPAAAKAADLPPAARARQEAELAKFAAENKAVREGVALVEKYQNDRKYAEAQGVIAVLGKQYPDNPAVLALQQKDSFANNLAESRMLTQMHAERYNAAMNAVMYSALPAKGDIEFPQNWKELTARRRKLEPQLTEKEKSILAALDKPMTAVYNGQSLEEVIQQLTNTLGQNIYVDTKSLKDLEIDIKKPVTLDAKGVPARIVLRQLLAGQGLTFVVKDEAIQVVTVEKARSMLVTRTYYLGDVVQGIGPFGGLAWGPLVDYQQTMENVRMIVSSIKSSIDPLSWSDASGPGTITFHFPSMSLIVRASSEVHASLNSKIGGGR